MMDDLISRQAAIEVVKAVCQEDSDVIEAELMYLPSAKYDRDTPKKPVEAIDQAWCAPHRQAECPRCANLIDYFTLGFGKGKRITYCKFCGQALDWKGWEKE